MNQATISRNTRAQIRLVFDALSEVMAQPDPLATQPESTSAVVQDSILDPRRSTARIHDAAGSVQAAYPVHQPDDMAKKAQARTKG